MSEALKSALADRYRIEREIGSGGMATVYLAQDLKHDRKVAVKVLRPELAAVLGAERFLSEIKVTANLQHPHILPLHDSGEANGFLFYVMPYVEGESLRAKLDREKQLGVEEAVGIARSVASALDYAHRHGVIHRDIKPANILLHDGQPMVADFGIALAVRAAGGARVTETGLSLGTPQYMSPEQASGDREVDGRADIYSLGCVLYEMLTGEPPHAGPTVQAIIAKLLTDKPRPVTELRETVPVHVAAVVHKALAKLPADRFRGALEFGDALSSPSFRIPFEAAPGPVRERTAGWSRSRERVVWSLVTLSALALGLWGVSREARPTPEPRVVRSSILLDKSAPMVFVGAGTGAAGWRAVSISRDGENLVYVGLDGGTPRLLLRNLSTGESRALEGTDQAFAPFFSWDGRSVGFFAGTDLFTLSLRPGSRPIHRAEFPNPTAGTWGPDDVITCSVAIGYELRRLSLVTGEEEIVRTEGGTLFPHLLPGGRRAITAGTDQKLWIVDLLDGTATPLGLSGAEGRYLRSGHLLYHVGTDLFVTPFDPENPGGVTVGDPVLSGVRTEVYGVGQFDVSETGALVYAPGGFQEGRLVRVGLDGSVAPLPYPSRVYSAFQISPDWTRLAISYGSASQGIVFLGLDRERVEPLTSNRFNNSIPIWSPDGSAVVYMNDASGRFLPVLHPLDGDPVPLPIPESWIEAFPESWSVNGYLALAVISDRSDYDVMAIELEGGNVVEVAATEALEWAAAFSPDGNWIAYTSDEQRDYGVYVQSFPPEGEARLVSQGYGEEPIWSRDGSTLFYRSLDRWMAVDVRTSPDVSFSDPREVLRGPYINIFHRSFDVWPDGQSLILVRPAGEETAASLEMIQGWFRELEGIGESGG